MKTMKSRSNPSNRSNPWVKVIDKWNQPSKSKVPLTTIDDDLHIGDDGLFSQSTFSDGLLADEEHLKSLCPKNTLLPRIFIQNDALSFLVEQLCQAVLHLKSLQNIRESLSILKKKGGKTTINEFIIPASECSLGIIDGAEFFQWTYRNHQAQLWYCPSIKTSPVLMKAIQSAIKISPMASQKFSFERIKKDTQFLGYVTAETSENVVNHLHIHSFVLFNTHQQSTNVICMMSSRIHIMHPMQERLLQLVQLLQFHQTAPTFNLNITNKVMFSYSEGNVANIKLQQFSLDAYEQFGFRQKKNSQDTQEENPNLFSLSIREFIEIVEYGDTYNWGIYARRILTSYRPNDLTKCSLPPLDSGLLKSFKGIFKQFLSRDPGGFLSYGLDKDMTVLLEKLVSDVTFPFRNDEELRNKSLLDKFDVAVMEAEEIGQKMRQESSIVTRFFDISVEAT
jgi:hypothetical protein